MTRYWKIVGFLAFLLSIAISSYLFYANSNSQIVKVEKQQLPAAQSSNAPKREMKL